MENGVALTEMPRIRGGVLALLLVAAGAVRLLFFTGLTLGDDVFYMSAAAALAEGKGWPPLPLHWHTRLGLIVPTALGLDFVGWFPLVMVWVPFITSLAGIGLCFWIVRQAASQRAAWIAAVLYAAFPLDVIYSTHLFPDAVIGVLSALAIWQWRNGLQTRSAGAFAVSGVAFGLGYLCRETVLTLLPVHAVLWLTLGRPRTYRMLWAALPVLLVVGVETLLYAVSTGNPLYRWHAMAAQQSDPENLQAIAASASGGGFWTDPLLMLITSHEFSIVFAWGVILAFASLWRHTELRWVGVWLLVGFGWLYYGTTIPTGWVPVQRDPRYAAPFILPAVLLVSVQVARWSMVWRTVAVGCLVTLGLSAALLDQRGSELTAHRAFLSSEFIAETVLEPFEYYGARWVAGLRSPVLFACASDVGRPSVAALASALPGTRLTAAGTRRYFVYSPERRPDLGDELRRAGWSPVAEIRGIPPRMRQFIFRLMSAFPTQQARAARGALPPRLVVLEHPGWTSRRTNLTTGSAKPGHQHR